MQGTVGFSWPAGQKVAYYKYRDPADLADNSECGQALACIDGLTWHVPVTWSTPASVVAYPAFPETAPGASVCADCTGSCTTVSAASPFAETVHGARVLRLVSEPDLDMGDLTELTLSAR